MRVIKSLVLREQCTLKLEINRTVHIKVTQKSLYLNVALTAKNMNQNNGLHHLQGCKRCEHCTDPPPVRGVSDIHQCFQLSGHKSRFSHD